MASPSPSNDSVRLDHAALVARSRQFCALADQHCAALARFVSPIQAREHGKHLGLYRRGQWDGSQSQQALVAELTAWTAREGRTTAIERYARQAQLAPGSDEAAVLAGMQNSVLSFWAAERRHPAGGWELRDLGWEGLVWVIDERIEQYLASGGSSCFGTRLFRSAPDGFAMSCSSIVPVPDVAAQFVASRQKEEAGKASGSAEHVRASRHSLYAAAIYTTILGAAS